MQTGNAPTFTAIVLAMGLAMGAATWHLRTFIRAELRKASYATDIRLEHRVAQIREELRAGRESTEREMSAIRRWFRDRQREGGDAAEPGSTRD